MITNKQRYSFLPLSFFTSLFGINVREWSGEEHNLTMSQMLEIAGTHTTSLSPSIPKRKH